MSTDKGPENTLYVKASLQASRLQQQQADKIALLDIECEAIQSFLLDYAKDLAKVLKAKSHMTRMEFLPWRRSPLQVRRLLKKQEEVRMVPYECWIVPNTAQRVVLTVNGSVVIGQSIRHHDTFLSENVPLGSSGEFFSIYDGLLLLEDRIVPPASRTTFYKNHMTFDRDKVKDVYTQFRQYKNVISLG